MKFAGVAVALDRRLRHGLIGVGNTNGGERDDDNEQSLTLHTGS